MIHEVAGDILLTKAKAIAHMVWLLTITSIVDSLWSLENSGQRWLKIFAIMFIKHTQNQVKCHHNPDAFFNPLTY